jgi:hypothetical protein
MLGGTLPDSIVMSTTAMVIVTTYTITAPATGTKPILTTNGVEEGSRRSRKYANMKENTVIAHRKL